MSLLSRPRPAVGTVPAPGRLGRVRAAWRREAQADRLPPWVADVVAWTPIVGTVALAAIYLVRRQTYYWVLREDHAVEWAQFGLLLFTSVVALVAARRLWGRQRVLTILLLVLALGAFGLAGEEISWAQRAFAFGTPEGLAAVNQQAEVNVHNVQMSGLRLQSVFKLISFVLAVAGLALAWLTRGPSPRLRSRFWEAAAVPSYTMVGCATMVAYWVMVVVAPINPVDRYQEWAEVSLYVALAATVVAIASRAADLVGSGPVDRGRPTRLPVDRVIVIALVVVTVLTVVLAALTVYHGIIPMNARESVGA